MKFAPTLTSSGKPLPTGSTDPALNRQAIGISLSRRRSALAASNPSDIRRGLRNVTRAAGFTLAEVLAALMFMAIVIPAALQGLRLANLAGQVAVRKTEAVRVAERVLNESIITTNWSRSGTSGTLMEGAHQFRWLLRNEAWTQEPIRLLSTEVSFSVQGQEYGVRLSTLVDNSPPQ